VASNRQWTWFYPHKQRGGEAMEEAGLLPEWHLLNVLSP